MEGQKYPKAVEHLESWKCGNHLVQDPYLYMQNAKDPQVLSWVAEENAYTDHWFEDKNLGQRIQQLKSQQKKPTYHNLCQVGEKLYAVCSGTDGSSAAVEMKSDFSEQKVLLNREMMGGTMNIYGVSPCPADPKIAAFFALKDKAARMSVVIRDPRTKSDTGRAGRNLLLHLVVGRSIYLLQPVRAACGRNHREQRCSMEPMHWTAGDCLYLARSFGISAVGSRTGGKHLCSCLQGLPRCSDDLSECAGTGCPCDAGGKLQAGLSGHHRKLPLLFDRLSGTAGQSHRG